MKTNEGQVYISFSASIFSADFLTICFPEMTLWGNGKLKSPKLTILDLSEYSNNSKLPSKTVTRNEIKPQL